MNKLFSGFTTIPRIPTGDNRRVLEFEIVESLDTNAYTIIMHCVECRTQTTIKIKKLDLLTDRDLASVKVQNMCHMHINAFHNKNV